MEITHVPHPSLKPPPDRIERALDAALEMTFPASDPVAVFVVEGEGPVALRTGDEMEVHAPM